MKFLLDKILSFLGLVVLSPIFAVVSVLVKINMPQGPVIFRQERVGRDGKLFNIYKFRTMREDPNSSPVSVAGDSRVTGLGKILRRAKLDELPQLWNILKGDMSFVGPRPDVPGYVDTLAGGDREILALRPGVTGPASLKYRNEEDILADVERRLRDGERIFAPDGSGITSVLEYNDKVIFPDKVRINRIYLRDRSLWLDIKIIVATVLRLRIDFAGERI